MESNGKTRRRTLDHRWGWGTAAGQRRLRRRAAHLRPPGDRNAPPLVLEIGAGAGACTQHLAGDELRLVGSELDPQLLRLARSRPPLPEPAAAASVCWCAADAHQLPFRARAFDAVVGNSVMHHLRRPRALRELHRVLRPGGLLTLTEPNLRNPHVWLQKTLRPLAKLFREDSGETALLPGRVATELATAGFFAIRVEPFDFLHPWTPRWLIPTIQDMERILERLPGVRHLAGSLRISARRSA